MESSITEGSDLPKVLVERLDDFELRINRLEGQRVFTSGEPPKGIDQYVDEHPEMISINEEMKRLIESGRVKIAT